MQCKTHPRNLKIRSCCKRDEHWQLETRIPLGHWSNRCVDFLFDSNATDSVASIEQMLSRHSKLAEMRRSGDQDEFNHGAATFLLEQAEGLISYGDFQTAEALVSDAEKFQVTYRPEDFTPAQVSEHLQRARQLAAVGAPGDREVQARRILSEAQLAFDQGKLTDASK